MSFLLTKAVALPSDLPVLTYPNTKFAPSRHRPLIYTKMCSSRLQLVKIPVTQSQNQSPNLRHTPAYLDRNMKFSTESLLSIPHTEIHYRHKDTFHRCMPYNLAQLKNLLIARSRFHPNLPHKQVGRLLFLHMLIAYDLLQTRKILPRNHLRINSGSLHFLYYKSKCIDHCQSNK